MKSTVSPFGCKHQLNVCFELIPSIISEHDCTCAKMYLVGYFGYSDHRLVISSHKVIVQYYFIPNFPLENENSICKVCGSELAAVSPAGRDRWTL